MSTSVETFRAADPELAALPLDGRHVLIVVQNLPVPFDRRVWLEARTLAAGGAHVSVICPQMKGYTTARETIEGIDVYRHPLPVEADGALGYPAEYGISLFWQSRLAWKIYRERPFHVIHACNPPDLGFLLAKQFRGRGVRYLFDHHDINPELFETKFGKRGIVWKAVCAVEKANFRAADVTIATNESYRDIAVARGGLAPENVFVVRSGPDLSKVKKVTPNPDWKKGRQYLLGYVGVMGEQEGIDLLLEALDELVNVRARKDIQTVLIGSGPALEDMKAMAARLGLADHVDFLGRAPDDVLFEVLSTADICVNPDRVTPMNDLSTMNKIMEYMAMGKPIVQFDVREGRVSAEEASVYAKANDPVDFANHIESLLADPEKRARMGQFGERRVHDKLSWETQIGSLLAAYRKIFTLSV